MLLSTSRPQSTFWDRSIPTKHDDISRLQYLVSESSKRECHHAAHVPNCSLRCTWGTNPTPWEQPEEAASCGRSRIFWTSYFPFELPKVCSRNVNSTYKNVPCVFPFTTLTSTYRWGRCSCRSASSHSRARVAIPLDT